MFYCYGDLGDHNGEVAVLCDRISRTNVLCFTVMEIWVTIMVKWLCYGSDRKARFDCTCLHTTIILIYSCNNVNIDLEDS